MPFLTSTLPLTDYFNDAVFVLFFKKNVTFLRSLFLLKGAGQIDFPLEEVGLPHNRNSDRYNLPSEAEK